MNKNSYSILFVDDEEKTLKYFSRIYSDEFIIHTAPDATEAKKLLIEHEASIGILITDQRMPDIKGIELLEHARREHPNIIRLLTTAYSDLSEAIEAVNSGEILRYITKPWDVDLLRMELRNAMYFFELKQERDQLINEKLHVKQRLINLNRARDLIVISSGFTHVHHSLPAITAFLHEIPFSHDIAIVDLNTLHSWDSVIDEITNVLDYCQLLINFNHAEHINTIETVNINSVLNEISNSSDESINIKCDANITAQASIPLIHELFSNLKYFVFENSEPDRVLNFEVNADADVITISLECSYSKWSDISILRSPADLIITFLICYHYKGNIKVTDNNKICLKVNLPVNPESAPKPVFNHDDLNTIFSKFDMWHT